MPVVMSLVLRVKTLLRDMSDNILMIYSEKGMEPFKKPLVVSISIVFVIYFFIYSTLAARVSATKFELDKWETIAAHYDDYETANNSMAAFASRLPALKDKEEWLNYIMTSTAKPYGIAFDSLFAQTENEVGNFLLVSRDVTVTTTYDKFGRWLADIENTPILLRVGDVNISKVANRTGAIKVTMKLSTIYPKYGATGGQGL